MIETCGSIFALPVTMVKEVLSDKAEQVKTTSREKVVVIRDQTLKIVQLSALLNLPSREAQRKEIPVVIVGEEDRGVALIVDAIGEREKIVVRPLENHLAQTESFSIETILGKGEVVPVLNPSDLLKR